LVLSTTMAQEIPPAKPAWHAYGKIITALRQ